MDLQRRKIEFVQEFLKIQNEELVSRLENMLHKENEKLDKNNFEAMSLEEFNSRIDSSMSDSKDGKLIKSTDLREKMKKWG